MILRRSPPLLLLSTVMTLWVGVRLLVGQSPGGGDIADAVVAGDAVPLPVVAAARPVTASPVPFPLAKLPALPALPHLPARPTWQAAKLGMIGLVPPPLLVRRDAAGVEPHAPAMPFAAHLTAEQYHQLWSLMHPVHQPKAGLAFAEQGAVIAPLRTGSAGSLLPPDAATDRWSASAWLALRDGSAAPGPVGSGPAALLGGSQAGGRLTYRLTGSGRAQAYARIVTAGRRMDGAEAALGLDWQPHRAVPLRLAVERREQITGVDARSAFAAFAVAGVSDRALPGGWRLDGYGAAGVVGARRRDGFAEGSLRVTRPLAAWGRAHLSAGAGSWAATQPGVSRVDVGPTMTLRLDGVAPRLSLDWRQRVAGEAAPDSGVALTLATDF